MSRHLELIGITLLPLVALGSCMGYSPEPSELGDPSEPFEAELEFDEPQVADDLPDAPPDPRANARFPDRPELVLQLEGKGPVSVESGAPVPVELSIKNVSDAEEKYVQAGDGSFAGWREPSIFYTAVRLGDDGQWHDVPEKDWGRCGMFDHDWQDEVTALAPSASNSIEWGVDPAWRLDLQKPGRVLIYAHYVFSAGAGFPSRGSDHVMGASTDLGGMVGVPAFELVSAPLEIKVERPLELSVMPTTFEGRAHKLSQVVSMALENVSDETHQVGAPTRDRFRVQLRRDESGIDGASLYASDGPTNATGEGAQVQLKRDHALDLYRDGVDFELPTVYQTGSFDIQIGYRIGKRTVSTDWVHIER